MSKVAIVLKINGKLTAEGKRLLELLNDPDVTGLTVDGGEDLSVIRKEK